METVKKFSQPKKICKDSFNFEHVWSLSDISKECEIAVSTSQNTASAHKAQHTLSQISNNSYPEVQKALRR